VVGVPKKKEESHSEANAKKAKWREQHEHFMKAIKISKQMKLVEENGGDKEQLAALAS